MHSLSTSFTLPSHLLNSYSNFNPFLKKKLRRLDLVQSFVERTKREICCSFVLLSLSTSDKKIESNLIRFVMGQWEDFLGNGHRWPVNLSHVAHSTTAAARCQHDRMTTRFSSLLTRNKCTTGLFTWNRVVLERCERKFRASVRLIQRKEKCYGLCGQELMALSADETREQWQRAEARSVIHIKFQEPTTSETGKEHSEMLNAP